MTTTASKCGNSRAIRLPKPILESLGLKDNDTVDIILDNDRIIIRKKFPHKSLKQRVEEFYGKDFETVLKENPYKYEEIDWGKPVGNEVW